MVYRFVQLSDIHFGQERGGTLVVHEDVRDMLLKDAAQLAENRGSADLVIVVGDIAFAGKEDEYKQAGEWLDRLTDAVQCGVTDVRIVPGNHDCDRTKIGLLGKLVHGNIRSGPPHSAHAVLEELTQTAEEVNPLLAKLKSYRTFAASYNSDFASMARPLWTKDFPLTETNDIAIRLVGMNSVQVSDEKDSSGNMILGNRQYILPAEPNLIYIVILHHPLDWYMDKVEAKVYLYNRTRVILVGHEHIPYINKSTDMLNRERLDIYSGATNPSELGALYRYTYNWLEISLRERSGSHVLVVNVFPRVWVPELTSFRADTQRLAGQESAEFEIACPDLKPAAPLAAQRTTSLATTSAEDRPAPQGVDDSTATGGNMATDDEASMAKLKFLFWRYLDWQQRLKVLVQADALPPTADQPVPQTMEQMALENARERGKLAAIWDAMMEYVPEAKRQANPFNRAGS